MAKLSARGRTEVWRIAKNGQKYALMSDGKLLSNYGGSWKVVKLKEDMTPEKAYELLKAKGYQDVKR